MRETICSPSRTSLFAQYKILPKCFSNMHQLQGGATRQLLEISTSICIELTSPFKKYRGWGRRKPYEDSCAGPLMQAMINAIDLDFSVKEAAVCWLRLLTYLVRGRMCSAISCLSQLPTFFFQVEMQIIRKCRCPSL